MNNRNEETDNNRQSIKLERELTEIERIVKELKSRYNELHKEYERRGRDPEYFNGIALELECLTCDIHGYTLQYDIKIDELLVLQDREDKEKEQKPR